MLAYFRDKGDNRFLLYNVFPLIIIVEQNYLYQFPCLEENFLEMDFKTNLPNWNFKIDFSRVPLVQGLISSKKSRGALKFFRPYIFIQYFSSYASRRFSKNWCSVLKVTSLIRLIKINEEQWYCLLAIFSYLLGLLFDI